MRISHVVFYEGWPTTVDELAMAIAREPGAPEAIEACDRIRALCNSYDPEQRAQGELEARAVNAAHAVRSVMNSPERMRLVVGASEAGDVDALAIRQGAAATRIADMKAVAWQLAAQVKSGDKTANQRAQACLRAALGGDVYSTTLAGLFMQAMKEVPAPVVATVEAEKPVPESAAPASAALNSPNPEKDPLADHPVGVTSAADPDEAAVVWFRTSLAEANKPAPPAEIIPTAGDPLVGVGTMSSSEGGVGSVGAKPANETEAA